MLLINLNVLRLSQVGVERNLMSWQHLGGIVRWVLSIKLIELVKQGIVVAKEAAILLGVFGLRLPLSKATLRGLVLVQNLNILVQVGLARIQILHLSI